MVSVKCSADATAGDRLLLGLESAERGVGTTVAVRAMFNADLRVNYMVGHFYANVGTRLPSTNLASGPRQPTAMKLEPMREPLLTRLYPS